MTNFEQITQSPEALAAFLSSLPCIEGPWNEEFHKCFCDACIAPECDRCPNEDFRGNPGWWLSLAVEKVPMQKNKYIKEDTSDIKCRNCIHYAACADWVRAVWDGKYDEIMQEQANICAQYTNISDSSRDCLEEHPK